MRIDAIKALLAATRPGPWLPSPKAKDAIIVEPRDGEPFYGGRVIAESIEPGNRAFIIAAPELVDRHVGIAEVAEFMLLARSRNRIKADDWDQLSRALDRLDRLGNTL
jgi:hypothetical protein